MYLERITNMANTDLPTPETLRKLLSYDPDTGLLTWKRRPLEMFASESLWKRWNARYCENLALVTDNGGGYRKGSIFHKNYLTHRVAYAIYHDAWPVNQIDHINGDKSDNRIANLRDVTSSENMRNRVLPIGNTSGHIGVSWRRGICKWRVQITAHGKNRHIGYFTDIEDAIAARAAAEVEYGYHANHGRP
jgi:hypothetical protein